MTCASRLRPSSTSPRTRGFYVLAGYVLLRAKARSFGNFQFAKSYPAFKTTPVKTDLVEALTVLDRIASRYQKTNAEMSRDSIFKSADFRDKYVGAIARVVSKRKSAPEKTTEDGNSAKKKKSAATASAPKIRKKQSPRK